MRRLTLLFAVFLAAYACADPGVALPSAADPTLVGTTVPTPSPSTTTTTVGTTSTASPDPDAASMPEDASLVLGARGPVEVFTIPGGTEPFRILEPETILGSRTVVTVLEGPEDGWARVMLPGRPNGSEGWVRSEEMADYVVEGQVVVDLSDRTLVYYEGGDEVLSSPVAVGSGRNPTPTGTFFVTDNVTVADPGGPWGPHALGLSARSDTITDYNGGDGIIGIHGTNRPGSIGEAASLGCVRAPNEVIRRLHEMVAIGTLVEIRA